MKGLFSIFYLLPRSGRPKDMSKFVGMTPISGILLDRITSHVS